jgi:hypothetical protein
VAAKPAREADGGVVAGAAIVAGRVRKSLAGAGPVQVGDLLLGDHRVEMW